MRYLILASLTLLTSCSLETKDGCSATGDKAHCEPTSTNTPPPPSSPSPTPDPQSPTKPVKPTALKCVTSSEDATGCVWTQVASGGSPLKIGEALFSDADDFQRYITHMLYEIGEEVDIDNDGNYLFFRNPREITNDMFVSKFKATFIGQEIKNATVYPEQGDIVAGRLLPGDYSLRVYASFDLVERNALGEIVASKCLKLENRTNQITVSAGTQTLLKPIDSFMLSLHDKSCSNSSTSFRDIVLPLKQQIVLPNP